MERKNFLKNSIAALGVAFVAPLAKACTKTGTDDMVTEATAADGTGTLANCTSTPSETDGPFPTKSPSSLEQSNIKGDRNGVAITIKIAVTNVTQNCAALAGALVDIWHCDAQGNYSEYGGSGMQSTNYTNVHWLRGRQVTDANGQVTFNSIFPGWYNGRSTHIHVHIYNASGKSLLVTQIAFPEAADSAVVAVNASTGYRGMSGYTYNKNDNVFGDGYAAELSSISGSVSGGYVLSHTIGVNA